MILSRYGLREWGLASAVACAALLIAGRGGFPPIWLVAVVGVLWFCVAAFFRDPLLRKPATNDPQDFVSPADGVISAIIEVDQHAATEGPATIIRIFLSVLDVHINRMPCSCEVIAMTHTPGKYLDARTSESAQVNESNLVQLKTTTGARIGVRQISGAIARRIVCPVSVGESFARAQRFGMIKFGSTTELIVPTSLLETLRVKRGDRVVGGVTILASMRAAAITTRTDPSTPSATAAAHA